METKNIDFVFSFEIGQKVFVVSRKILHKDIPCDFCLGEKKVLVIPKNEKIQCTKCYGKGFVEKYYYEYFLDKDSVIGMRKMEYREKLKDNKTYWDLAKIYYFDERNINKNYYEYTMDSHTKDKNPDRNDNFLFDNIDSANKFIEEMNKKELKKINK